MSVARLIPSTRDSRQPYCNKRQGRTFSRWPDLTHVVVELGLGNGVVDVDGRDLELAISEHLVKVVDTSGGLLRNTSDLCDSCQRETKRLLFFLAYLGGTGGTCRGQGR